MSTWWQDRPTKWNDVTLCGRGDCARRRKWTPSEEHSQVMSRHKSWIGTGRHITKQRWVLSHAADEDIGRAIYSERSTEDCDIFIAQVFVVAREVTGFQDRQNGGVFPTAKDALTCAPMGPGPKQSLVCLCWVSSRIVWRELYLRAPRRGIQAEHKGGRCEHS